MLYTLISSERTFILRLLPVLAFCVLTNLTPLFLTTAQARPVDRIRNTVQFNTRARDGSLGITWNTKPDWVDETSYYWQLFHNEELASRLFHWMRNANRFRLARPAACGAQETLLRMRCRGTYDIVARDLLKEENWETNAILFDLYIPHPYAFEKIDDGLMPKYEYLLVPHYQPFRRHQQYDTNQVINGLETRLVRWRGRGMAHHRCNAVVKLPFRMVLLAEHNACSSLEPMIALVESLDYLRLLEKLGQKEPPRPAGKIAPPPAQDTNDKNPWR